jgi:hypothetical protein
MNINLSSDGMSKNSESMREGVHNNIIIVGEDGILYTTIVVFRYL